MSVEAQFDHQTLLVPTRRRHNLVVAALLSRRGIAGLVCVGLVVAAGLLAPLVAPADPLAQTSGADLLAPSLQHLLGTDEVGRDILSRLLFGIREDLVIIVAGVSLGLVIGTSLGLFATANVIADSLVQRVIDLLLATPGLLLGALLAAFLGPGRTTVIAVMVLVNIPAFGRLTRTAVQSQLTQDYVVAATTLGMSRTRLLVRHVLPNSVDAVIVQTALACGHAAFLEGGLSLVGFGITAPTPSLGSLINGSLSYLSSQPWYAVGPMIVIIALVIGFNLIADAINRGLRDG